MVEYKLAFKPAKHGFGDHDPSAVIFEGNSPVYGIEEERLTREKHAQNTFPYHAIKSCLEAVGVSLSELDEIILPYDPDLWLDTDFVIANYKREIALETDPDEVSHLLGVVDQYLSLWHDAVDEVKAKLRELDGSEPLPPVTTRVHHACHAASAFHLSPFEQSTVLTIDGCGETDSTVVWHGTERGLERVRTYKYPNSLGQFFGTITEYLGFRYGNGEGKVMGLASYGNRNEQIENELYKHVSDGVDYDVTGLTDSGVRAGLNRLESWFDRPRKTCTEQFDQWERDLAYTAQKFLENTVTSIVEEYCTELDCRNVSLSGGVVLNCKMNKQIIESESVADTFIQPVANDAGLALGAGLVGEDPTSVEPMSTVYYGPSYSDDEITALLEREGIKYTQPEQLERVVAELIADGALVGWFQHRTEMGPRALGNRSILADPRTEESRYAINEYVKHREQWRPFAPSMTADAADEYLVDADQASFMIRAFDVTEKAKQDIPAVIHSADQTTRPQIVTENANSRYHRLLTEFGDLTGVPVLLNTSFNDNGEPIVNTPMEALDDFFSTELDVLVLGGAVIQKEG
ncbi:carbamoyltransferase family protein [Halorussus ruber]|uniref:carbamoyltransferase family protein n=1 Tax=Halorussus ruber TaxID=1126238 RepID=UPI001B2FF19E|nr:carbamoyltransferase C-terminal domain-containing protein [Halorussus ruber]